MWQWVDYGSTTSTTSGVPMTPNLTFFPKDQTWEWAFKVSGSYLLPGDVLAAAFFASNSGQAYARSARFTTGLKQLTQVILLMEPTGSQRLPSINLMSARAEKRVKIGRTTATFQFDVFNLLNSNVPTQIVARSGSTYGNPLTILSPRIARLGVTFTY